MKRIIICADGTWNRPESNLKKDLPTNVLALAVAYLLLMRPMPNKLFFTIGASALITTNLPVGHWAKASRRM
jgi:hypothetical protein